MTALIIIGAILALLLLSPVAVDISYRQGDSSLTLRYLVYRRALSAEALTKKTAKEPAEEAVKQREEQGEGKAKSAKDTAGMIWSLVKSSRKGLSILRRHLVFSRVQVYISVGCPDAHQTALRYGQTGAAVQTALDIVRMMFVLKKPKVAVAPDFTRGDTRSDIRLRIGIRPVFLLAAAASVFRQFLRIKQQDNKNTDQTEQIKGGKTA